METTTLPVPAEEQWLSLTGEELPGKFKMLPPEQRDGLIKRFAPFMERLIQVVEVTSSIEVNDETDVAKMAEAKQAKIATRDIRLEAKGVLKLRKSTPKLPGSLWTSCLGLFGSVR
jgi:hypothetical protein